MNTIEKLNETEKNTNETTSKSVRIGIALEFEEDGNKVTFVKAMSGDITINCRGKEVTLNDKEFKILTNFLNSYTKYGRRLD